MFWWALCFPFLAVLLSPRSRRKSCFRRFRRRGGVDFLSKTWVDGSGACRLLRRCNLWDSFHGVVDLFDRGYFQQRKKEVSRKKTWGQQDCGKTQPGNAILWIGHLVLKSTQRQEFDGYTIRLSTKTSPRTIYSRFRILAILLVYDVDPMKLRVRSPQIAHHV